MEDFLSNVMGALQEVDKQEKVKINRAKKAASKVKPTETMQDAERRILGMKLKDDERAIVQQVFSLLRTGEASRLKEGKMSKKEVFDMYQIYREHVRDLKRRHVIDTKPENFWIVTDRKQLLDIHDMLQEEDDTSWDTETTGLDIYNDKVVGYSAYLPKNNIAFYLPFGHITCQAQLSEEEAEKLARWYLTNSNNKTNWHHYKYDGHLLLTTWGIRVANPFWDTQVVAKLLYEHESHRLKDLYAKYILKRPDDAIMFEDLFDDFKIYDKDIILAGIYAAGDAEKTHKLRDFQKPFIDTLDNLKTVWYTIEQHLLQTDLDMERTGFRIDLDRLKGLEMEFEPIIQQAEQDIKEAFNIGDEFLQTMSKSLGRQENEFNINSPQHLAYLIYDHLGVDPKFGTKFKKGERSTAADVVDALCRDHEELKPLLEYRTLNKLLTTYIKKIPNAMEPATGKLHSRFNNLAGDDGQSGAATGRYSSSEYVSGKNSATGNNAKGTNLQNIPSKGKGVEIRRCFIPDDGWILVGADLSQIEPRVIAHILNVRYGDSAMLEFYLAGKDLYTEMAMRTFNLPRENCVDGAYDPSGMYQPRKLIKQGVLAYLYGQSPAAFARTMKVTEAVATSFFEGMIKAFTGLKPFRDDIIGRLMTEGNVAHVTTLYGRKRRFPEYRKWKSELNRIEANCYADGLEIYREGKLKGKTLEENAEIQKRMWRIESDTLTEDDKEKIMRIGLYWRHKEWKETYWLLRGKVKSIERQAVNTIIQGSAADILKMNMIAVHKWVVKNGYKLNASIHDELLLSVPESEVTPDLIEQIRKFMCETVELSVPLRTDIVIGRYWMQETKPEDWDFEKQQPKVKTGAA